MKRLAKDQVTVRRSLPPNYFFEDPEAGQALPDDLTELLICITGAEGTPYAQGMWQLKLEIPLNYPQHPPTATFKTRIFHPNVAEETGAVCLETLKRDWDPKLTLKDILITISCLLIQPNPDSALNQKAGALIQDDYNAFARHAKLMTKIHASIPPGLLAAASDARRRGEGVEDTLQSQSASATTRMPANSPPPKENQLEFKDATRRFDTEKPAKRPITEVHNMGDYLPEHESRRRKSPKHKHTMDEASIDSAEVAHGSDTILEKLTEVVSNTPLKVVFHASWRHESRTTRSTARIGIRRL